jgi:hypothetical protein
MVDDATVVGGEKGERGAPLVDRYRRDRVVFGCFVTRESCDADTGPSFWTVRAERKASLEAISIQLVGYSALGDHAGAAGGESSSLGGSENVMPSHGAEALSQPFNIGSCSSET